MEARKVGEGSVNEQGGVGMNVDLEVAHSSALVWVPVDQIRQERFRLLARSVEADRLEPQAFHERRDAFADDENRVAGLLDVRLPFFEVVLGEDALEKFVGRLSSDVVGFTSAFGSS
jgi:hypothetical protein